LVHQPDFNDPVKKYSDKASAATSICKVRTRLFSKTNSADQTQDSKKSKNFQHVSAGPQPIFGLAVGLRGLGAARMKHAGPPGPGGCYEMPENLFSYSLSDIHRCKLLGPPDEEEIHSVPLFNSDQLHGDLKNSLPFLQLHTGL
jgi:hypothetical protein